MTMPATLRNRWWIVAAASLAMMVGQGPITIFTFSVFLKPVTASLDISRGALSSAVGLLTIAAAIVTPLLGRLIDRFGVRTVLMPMIVLFALSTMALSLIQSSMVVLYLLFILQGAFSASQTPTAYVKVISAWFDRTRGLALGIAQTGVGIGIALIPRLAETLIAAHGWRAAYVGLGVVVLIFALLPVALFLREPAAERDTPAHRVLSAGAAEPAIRGRGELAGIGMSLSEVWRMPIFWRLNICFFMATMAINGTLTHSVALITDRGVPLATALGAISLAGIAVIFGRLAAGYALDLVHGRYVVLASFFCPIAGIALLAFAQQPALLLAGTALCGLGVGAEVDLMAYFIGRYFGMRCYGAIYGLFFSTFTIGTGLGPIVMGVAFDHGHSYKVALAIFELALLAASGLALTFGAYRYPAVAAQKHKAAQPLEPVASEIS